MPQEQKKIPPSRHMVWYREIVPATVPVILLGTGIFFTLTLLQTHLSHSRTLSDSSARITRLEQELAELREKHSRQAVNWSEGLGRVVRRVRDLGREVHEFDDLKVLATAPHPAGSAGAESMGKESNDQHLKTESIQPPSLPARIIAAFGGGGGGSSSSPSPSTTQPHDLAHQTAAHVNDVAHQAASNAISTGQDLARTTSHKMNTLRASSSSALTTAESTVSDLVDEVRHEAQTRLTTLPSTPSTDLDASIRDAPGGETFARRLLATFGNPVRDPQETKTEVNELIAGARETSVQDLTQGAARAGETIHSTVHESMERIADRLDPAAQLAGAKMDRFRETATDVVGRVERTMEGVVHELREEADERLRTLPPTPETDFQAALRNAPGGETFAAKLLATFGDPRTDGERTVGEVRALERAARETSVKDLQAKVSDAAGVVSETLHDGFEHVAERMDPVVQRVVAPKIDQWRESSAHVVDRVERTVEGVVADMKQEAEERLRTLPPTPQSDVNAAIKDAPVPKSFAARLLSTFGNPSHDSTKTSREVHHAAEQLAHLAQEQETRAADLARDVASGVREAEHRVEAGLQELRAQGVKPFVQATAEKLDSLGASSRDAVAHAEEQIQHLNIPVPTSLPRPVESADGDYPAETPEQGVLASRLIATFGRPSEDRGKAARELASVKTEAEKVVERGEEAVRPVVHRAEECVDDVKGRVAAEVEGKKRWWS